MDEWILQRLLSIACPLPIPYPLSNTSQQRQQQYIVAESKQEGRAILVQLLLLLRALRSHEMQDERSARALCRANGTTFFPRTTQPPHGESWETREGGLDETGIQGFFFFIVFLF